MEVDPSFWEEQARLASRYELGRLETELCEALSESDEAAAHLIEAKILWIRAHFPRDFDATGRKIPLRAWPIEPKSYFQDQAWDGDRPERDALNRL